MQIRIQDLLNNSFYQKVRLMIRYFISALVTIGLICCTLIFLFFTKEYRIPISYCNSVPFYSKLFTLIEIGLSLFIFYSVLYFYEKEFYKKCSSALLIIIFTNQLALSLFLIYTPYLNQLEPGSGHKPNYFLYFLDSIDLLALCYTFRIKFYRKQWHFIFPVLLFLLYIIVQLVMSNATMPPICQG